MEREIMFEEDIKISKEKWQERYTKEGIYELAPQDLPIEVTISSDYARRFLLNDSLDTPKTILEAGCGSARTSLALSFAHRLRFVCADISLNALKVARGYFTRNNPSAQAYFVCCDLRYLPFKEGSVDFIFSDGAIEHFKDTASALSEFHRILKPLGKSFVTVPNLSLGMLTYGQLQGNIPNIPVLRTAFEFVHLKLFKARFLSNGYELSFSQSQMNTLFKKADFKNIETGHFKTYNEIRFFKNKIIKGIFRWLSDKRLFWPLIYAYGVKL